MAVEKNLHSIVATHECGIPSESNDKHQTNVKQAKRATGCIKVPYSPFDKEIWIFLILMVSGFVVFSNYMGINHFFSSLMKTAHDLLINTVFLITGITILMGAMNSLMAEYGILALANQILSPVTKVLYKMPGVSVIVAITCFFSDNPAVMSLVSNKSFRRYFKKYQVPAGQVPFFL